MKLKEKYNIPLFLAAFALVVFFVILLLLFPTQMNNGISAAFNWCTSAAGTPVQLLNLSLIILSLYIALSKYGNVKLGKGKPKYSTFSWLGMIFTSGLGAATMYWGIVEWTFLYNSNPLVTSGGVVSDVAPVRVGVRVSLVPLEPVCAAHLYGVRRGLRLSLL